MPDRHDRQSVAAKLASVHKQLTQHKEVLHEVFNVYAGFGPDPVHIARISSRETMSFYVLNRDKPWQKVVIYHVTTDESDQHTTNVTVQDLDTFKTMYLHAPDAASLWHHMATAFLLKLEGGEFARAS